MPHVPAQPRHAQSRLSPRRLLAVVSAVVTLGAILTATAGAPAQAEPDPTTPVRTYETEQPNAAPSGCTAPTGRAPIVSNHPTAPSHPGTRALLISDQTSTAQIATACPIAPRTGADLEFAVHPVAVPNGYTMSLLGHWQGATGAAVPIFHLAVFADGSFKWYDGTAWTTFAPGGTVPIAQWSTVRVQVAAADQSKATVSVNGTQVGEVRPAGTQAVRDIAGYQFASSGTTSFGDEVFFDNVAMINERGYETEPVGSVPEACAAPEGALPATVVGTGAATGSRALRLNDRSETAVASLQCQVSPQRGIDWEFSVNPAVVENAFAFSVLGHIEGMTDQPRTVFHLAAFADGSLRWYDLRDWTAVTKAGTLATGRWSRVRIQVPSDMESARIFIDGKYVGAAGPVGVRAVTAVTGYQFSSSAPKAINDDVTIDDLTVRKAVDGPLPGGTPGVELGAYTSIERAAAGELAQMPHGAVAIPGAQGTEALVTFARHRDLTEATGTALKRSTNGGGSWQDAGQSNPFPNEQSYHLTRLPDGRVIAVNYHTFMDPNSAKRATVDTAIYSDPDGDGVKTWTKRTGAITTTWDMRPITSRVTSRPGQPLGGFLLLHNVIAGPDGALYIGGYGYYKADGTKFRQVLFRSTDDGVNWKLLATVAVNENLSSHPNYEGFGEGTMQFVGNTGEMLMVMRTGSYQPMYYSRSTNYGVSWSTPAPIKAGPDALPVPGVDPMLLKTPDGKLVLNYGRPGRSLLISPDGRGDTWQSPVVIDYRNSANGSMVMTGDNQLLVFSDRGPDWAAIRPLVSEVWSRKITLTP